MAKQPGTASESGKRAAPRPPVAARAAAPKAAPRTPAPRAKANSKAARQVVIVVHGMGEQRPMDTIRDFARTAWEDDPAIMRPHDRPAASETAADSAIDAASESPRETMWNRPDPRLGSLELRKLTTRASLPSPAFPNGVATDFVELYWADLTEGATMRGVLSWLRMLLFRRPSRAPSSVLPHYLFFWAILLSAGAVIGAVLLHRWGWIAVAPPYAALMERATALFVLLSGVILLLGRYAENMLVARIGRVARYTQARPENIGARAATRERGLALLRALHADPAVDRIILVGHSLGAILAYDLLTYYWAELDAPRRLDGAAADGPAKRKFDAYRALEEARAALIAAAEAGAAAGPYDAALTRWRTAQAAFRRTLADAPPQRGGDGLPAPEGRWLISDFLTLGAPLAHAEFLLARDREDLMTRQAGRELPTNPPKAEPLDKDDARAAARLGLPPHIMSYWSDRSQGARGWRLHHASPFAAVRWTNIYDAPPGLFLWGDFVSGPVGRKRERGETVDLFGAGVRDLALKRDSGERGWRATLRAGLFTHSRYWTRTSPKARLALFRRALDLLDKDEPGAG